MCYSLAERNIFKINNCYVIIRADSRERESSWEQIFRQTMKSKALIFLSNKQLQSPLCDQLDKKMQGYFYQHFHKKKKSLFVQSNNFKHGCVLRLELGFITFTLKYPRIFNLILSFRTPTISRLVTKSMDYIFFSNRRKQLYMNFILSKNKWSLNKQQLEQFRSANYLFYIF